MVIFVYSDHAWNSTESITTMPQKKRKPAVQESQMVT